jgi:adenosylcobinamide-GDP ribazoletransferase
MGTYLTYIKRFILMIQFLTTIPLSLNLDVKEEDFGKGLIFAPVIGLIIGGILVASFWCLSFVFPGYIAVILTFIIYVILTGGLHIDGLGDTFDGLFSNRSKERILEIMRDSRVGTNAVIAIVSVILLDVAFLAGISGFSLVRVLILMPVAGRIGSLVGAGVSKYARSSEGLGKSFIDYCGIKEIAIGLIFYIAIFFFTFGLKGLVLSIFPVLTAFILIRYFSGKIGGATGDILGAVCELNQTLFLLAVYIILHSNLF